MTAPETTTTFRVKSWDLSTWESVRLKLYTQGLAALIATVQREGLPESWDSPVTVSRGSRAERRAQGSLLVDAVHSGQTNLVRWVMAHGGNPASLGLGMGTFATTPLLAAVRRDDTAMVSALLDDPRTLATVNLYHAASPLGVAAGHNNVTMLARLLDAGALIDGPLADGSGRKLPMRPVDEACSQGAIEAVAYLLDQAPDRDAMLNGHKSNDHHGSEGTTLLMQAAWFGHADLVRWLMDQGADAQAKDPYGMDVLQRTNEAVARGMSPSGGPPAAVLRTLQRSLVDREQAVLQRVATGVGDALPGHTKPRL